MVIFDLETDGLLNAVSVIHVLNIIDRDSGDRLSYHDHPEVDDRDGPLAAGYLYLVEAINKGRTVAGHNLIRYDIPVLKKFYPEFWVSIDQVLDSFVVSQLIWTDLYGMDERMARKGKRTREFIQKRLKGRHSLEAWGHRLGQHKGEFKGPWDTFTPEMAAYGRQDLEVNLALIEKIEEQNYSEEAIRLEHQVAEIIYLQEQHGFYFYKERAEKLAVGLQAETASIEDQLREAFMPWFEPERYKGQKVVVDPKRRRTAKVVSDDGEEWRASYEPGAPYCKVKLVSFEPGSRDKIANRLTQLYGWEPTEFTATGKPEVNESTLATLEYPEVKLLSRYLVLKKLLGTVASGKKAWLKSVKANSRIHSPVKSNGAITGRMTHADHIAQVPKLKKDRHGNVLKGYAGRYGWESRNLFGAPPSKLLVGADADGLELRMLGHYMGAYDGGAYAKAVVDGDKADGTDAHSLNRKAVGLRTRDGAKTWIYAYLYGAGDLKLGTIFYEDMDEKWQTRFNRQYPPGRKREKALVMLGKKGRSKIESGFPALGRLQEAVKKKAKSRAKQLTSLDGRKLNIRAQHSALNTLLQGAGAVVMKKALVLAYRAALARGWEHGREFAFVANVHDEFQQEVIPEYAEKVGQIAADAIRRAGEAFDLRVPLAGSADIGQTWADTH